MTDPIRSRSYKLTDFGKALEKVEENAPDPTGTQVLLRVNACGVCHSDLHIMDGHFDLGGGKVMDLKRGISLPRTMGHEIAGTVVAVGPDATGVKAGDQRVVFPWGGCGTCSLCMQGLEHLCARPRTLGTTLDGGYSDYVLVDKPEFLLEYDPLPQDFAATLACSGLTSFSALKKAAPIDDDNPLLIIGAGGVGLAATGLAVAAFGVRPIVAEIDASRRDAALAAGAAQVVDPTDPTTRKELLKQTGGFAAVIDFVGAQATADFGLSLLRKGGRMIMVGLFGGALELPLPTVPLRGISIIGSYVGSLSEFKELLELARAGKVKPMPLNPTPMENAQAALDDLRAGHVRGRTVLTNPVGDAPS